MKRFKRKAQPSNKLGRTADKIEHLTIIVWANVEQPFHVIKNLFRHRKTRDRGLAKNSAQLFTLFSFTKLAGCTEGALSSLKHEKRPYRLKVGDEASNKLNLPCLNPKFIE